jgi:hypothetical protein
VASSTQRSLLARHAATAGVWKGALNDQGATLFVGDYPGALGPVIAEGIEWYAVGPRDDQPNRPPGIQGWAAGGGASGSFLATIPPRCEEMARVQLTPFEGLACFGRHPMTFEGTYGCGECGGFDPGMFEPAWLASPFPAGLAVVNPKVGQGIGRTLLRIPPGAGYELPVSGAIVRLTGHYDDPAAATCRITFGGEGDARPAPDPRAVLYYCREQLVMDGYEMIGVDSSYPPR